MNASPLPRNLTSYDFLKMAAVLLMIVDHLGYYFFPEDLWLRAIGRWCVPIWFFLIGYANSRSMNKELWVGVLVLAVSSVIAGQSLFPFSILATILIIRMILDTLMDFAMENPRNFWTLSVVMALLTLPTTFLFEYGSEGFVLAMVGYLIRRREQVSDGLIDLFVLFAFLTFVTFETILFGFDRNLVILVSAGIVAVFVFLYYFKPTEFPKLTRTMPIFVTKSIKIFGRHTLLIYVGHLVLFRLLALYLFPEQFQAFNWSFF